LRYSRTSSNSERIVASSRRSTAAMMAKRTRPFSRVDPVSMWPLIVGRDKRPQGTCAMTPGATSPESSIGAICPKNDSIATPCAQPNLARSTSLRAWAPSKGSTSNFSMMRTSVSSYSMRALMRAAASCRFMFAGMVSFSPCRSMAATWTVLAASRVLLTGFSLDSMSWM